MRTYINSKCPYCGKTIRFMQSQKVLIVSPIQQCINCKKIYFDSQYFEIATREKDYYILLSKKLTISWIMEVISILGILLVCTSSSFHSIVSSTAFICILFALLFIMIIAGIFIRTYSWVKITPDFWSKYDESVSRLTVPGYIDFLKQHGIKVSNNLNR